MITIDKICAAIARSARETTDAEAIALLAKSTDIVGKTYAILKEVELHERFHLEAENRLPGEDTGPNFN
jgi:hypothetical protein